MTFLDKTEMGERLKLVRQTLKITQKEMSEELDFDRGYVGNWEKGHTGISIGVLEGIVRLYKERLNKRLNLNWLFLGIGDMHLPDPAASKFNATAHGSQIVQANHSSIQQTESGLQIELATLQERIKGMEAYIQQQKEINARILADHQHNIAAKDEVIAALKTNIQLLQQLHGR